MALFKKKQRADPETEKLKSFLDMIAPSLVRFEFDRYFCGNSIRCVWALREYPTATDDQAILRHLGEMHGVTLTRTKLNVDKLKLRQQQGFCCVSPCGYNAFGTEYERVLPAGSVANLFPFNYSGKTDRKGFYIGKDKCGSNIVVDFDQRDEDKTSANILILGNTGQGKSFLMKLLLLNFLEAGKSIITLDVEHEQWEMCWNRAAGIPTLIRMMWMHRALSASPRGWRSTFRF